MKKMASALLLFCVFGQPAFSSELDPVAVAAPQGVIVRVNADGSQDVFKAELKNGVVDTDAAAIDALKANIKDANKLESVVPSNELDQVSSDNSWYSWGGYDRGYSRGYRSGYSDGYRDGYRSGYYTGYSYSYSGYSYSYYPSYSYSSRGCNYQYYYTPSYYPSYGGYYYVRY